MATEVIAMVADSNVAVDASVEGRAAAAKKRLRVLAASFRMLSTLIAKVKSRPEAAPRSLPQQAQPQASAVVPKRAGPPRSFFCASAPATDCTASPHMRIGGGAHPGPSSNGGTAPGPGEHRARALSGQPDGALASCRVHGASDSALPELDATHSDCFAMQLTATSPDPLTRCHTLSSEAPSTPLSYLHCSGSLYPALPHAALSYPGQPADLAPPARGAAAACSRSPPASGAPAAQQPQAHSRLLQPYCLPSPDSPRPSPAQQQKQQRGHGAAAANGGGGGWRQALSFARGPRNFRLHRQQQQQQASSLPCSQSADLDANRGRGPAAGGRALLEETPSNSPRVAGGSPSDWPFPLSAASPVSAAAAPRVVLQPYSASATASPTARLAAATLATAPSLSLSAQLQQWQQQRQQQQAPVGTPGEPATPHDGTSAATTGKQVTGAGPAGAARSLHVRPVVLSDANTHASVQQQQQHHHHLAAPLHSVLEHQASAPDTVVLDPASLKVCPAPSSPGGRLLRLSPSLPAAMRRARWNLEEDYAIARRLYKGGTSSVYKATCLHSGIRVALKVYFLSKVPETVLHMLRREVSIHAAVSATRSPHVLHLYAAFETDLHLVLVQEYAALGDLYHAVQHVAGADGAAAHHHHAHAPPRLAEGVLGGRVLLPLCRALALLHGRGIVHRDVKPENLLLCRPEDCPAEEVAGGRPSGGGGSGSGGGGWLCKLADFGVSVDLNRERAVTRAGTVCYMAPEVERCPLKYFPDDNKDNPSLAYTTAADIWSVGILAYELLVGVPPLLPTTAPPPSFHHAHHAHGPERAVLSFPASVSAAARDLITWALSPRPEDRPTAVQLLQHPWLAAAAAGPKPGRRQELAAAGV